MLLIFIQLSTQRPLNQDTEPNIFLDTEGDINHEPTFELYSLRPTQILSYDAHIYLY